MSNQTEVNYTIECEDKYFIELRVSGRIVHLEAFDDIKDAIHEYVVKMEDLYIKEKYDTL